jgi:lipopolysaccharide transport system ATP-binding protein
MSDTVIRVENLGKKYIIGHQQQERYTALRDVITNKVKSLGSLINPKAKNENPAFEEFWALKDVSFEIKQGDRVGIIGRNGAGKSTLLKILSRITEPTKGSIKIKGRVASLLEVGTGFHPELTGRENIFLNGAILGMGKEEIKRKFDEIVAFAEVEKFLDTPVKRYSSGMYVRLAFAVAAHLEPEILIVDEVLAVGDAAFQKKCLGKMEDIADKEGRTILFVSHNMAAIKSLTSICGFFERGKICFFGKTDQAIKKYLNDFETDNKPRIREKQRGHYTKILECTLIDENGEPSQYYTAGQPLSLEIDFYTNGFSGLSLEVFLTSLSGDAIALASTGQFHQVYLPNKEGYYRCQLNLQFLYLASGTYCLNLATSIPNMAWDSIVESATTFEVRFSNPTITSWDFKYSYGYGAIPMICSNIPIFKDINPPVKQLII